MNCTESGIAIMSRKLSVDDDETATSDRSGIGGGSNHNHIGTAMTGAMQKISSPIGGTLRKVVRKTNSNGTQHDDVDERTADKNPSDHSSGSNKKNSTATISRILSWGCWLAAATCRLISKRSVVPASPNSREKPKSMAPEVKAP